VRSQGEALALGPHLPEQGITFAKYYLSLLEVLIDLKDHAAAAKEASKLAASAPSGWNDFHQIAVVLGSCMNIAMADKTLSEAERKKLAKSYGDKAIAMLREAVSHGYKDVASLKVKDEYALLRTRDDFKKLIAELEQKK
jgi:hypothetical protein